MDKVIERYAKAYRRGLEARGFDDVDGMVAVYRARLREMYASDAYREHNVYPSMSVKHVYAVIAMCLELRERGLIGGGPGGSSVSEDDIRGMLDALAAKGAVNVESRKAVFLSVLHAAEGVSHVLFHRQAQDLDAFRERIRERIKVANQHIWRDALPPCMGIAAVGAQDKSALRDLDPAGHVAAGDDDADFFAGCRIHVSSHSLICFASSYISQ